MQIGGVWSLGTSLVPRIYVTPNFLGRGLRAGNLLGNFFFFFKFLLLGAKIQTWVRMLIRVSSDEQERTERQNV